MTAASGSSGRWGFPAARLNSLQEETKTLDFFFLIQSISFQPRDVHPGLPLSQGHPRVAALRGCPGAGPVGTGAAPPLRPAAIPGPDRVNPGAAGRGGTCRQMSVSSLCQQPGGSVQAQEMLQGGPRTFFFFFLPSRTGFGGGSVTALRCGEQRGAGKERGAALTPHISSLFLPSTSHLLPYLPCAATAVHRCPPVTLVTRVKAREGWEGVVLTLRCPQLLHEAGTWLAASFRGGERSQPLRGGGCRDVLPQLLCRDVLPRPWRPICRDASGRELSTRRGKLALLLPSPCWGELYFAHCSFKRLFACGCESLG